MTTTIRDITELQDRRIMMEKKLPPFGYALILLTAALMLFLVVWSTKNYRTYVSQSSGTVQAANKTYITGVAFVERVSPVLQPAFPMAPISPAWSSETSSGLLPLIM